LEIGYLDFEILNNIMTTKLKIIHLIIGLVIVLGIASCFFYCQSRQFSFKEGYQAVFLSNGQVYFGKIQNENRRYLELTDIYYLQLKDSLQGQDINKNDDEKSDMSLVKLGNELHGPADRMLINRDQVLFIENLKNDSKVIKAIGEYKH
jgi:hypothetical protein